MPPAHGISSPEAFGRPPSPPGGLGHAGQHPSETAAGACSASACVGPQGDGPLRFPRQQKRASCRNAIPDVCHGQDAGATARSANRRAAVWNSVRQRYEQKRLGEPPPRRGPKGAEHHGQIALSFIRICSSRSSRNQPALSTNCPIPAVERRPGADRNAAEPAHVCAARRYCE
jgi:hypothetical protein